MTEIIRQRPIPVETRRLRLASWGVGGSDDSSSAHSFHEHEGNWWSGDTRDFDPRHDTSDMDRGLYNHGGEVPGVDPRNDPEWEAGGWN